MTFREWLEREKDKYQGTQNVYEDAAYFTLKQAIKEFDRRFTVATLEDLAESVGTIWIEQNGEDDPE